MVSHETKITDQLRYYGPLTDDLIAKLAGLPLYIAKAARRRLVRSGVVVAHKVLGGRMAWKLAK